MSTAYEVRDGVAVITLENPPVNGLGHATRAGIAEGLAQAQADAQVRAIVLIGGGKAFSGGADIREFNTPKATQSPLLVDVIAALDACGKPVVAAVHAVAMGGGLELALACHYRVGLPGAQIALPEVKLGLLPGAGGTQRLPRAIGVARALDMVVTGRVVKSEALAGTLFTRIIDGGYDDLRNGAIAFATDVAAQGGALPRLRDVAIEDGDGSARAAIDAAREKVQREQPHFPAPHKCVAAVEAALQRPFDDGVKFERECFVALVSSPESKALRHAFLGERAASKIADVPDDTPVRNIERVAVIGAGTMGSGIAMTFANAGLPVTLVDTTEAALARGVEAMRGNYARAVTRGKLTAEEADKRLARIQGSTDFASVADADLIVEAVFEDMAIKQVVFRELDKVAKTGAILASNTSTLDLDALARATSRAPDVIGMHFFSPANVMRLLEVVRGANTGKDVLATIMKLAKRIGKLAVVARVCDGFIGNRMLEPYFKQSQWMVEQGATPAQIDVAIERFGFAMGPFRTSDLAGNDVSWAIRKRRHAEHPGIAYPKIADVLCEAGRYGQKTHAGWYDYAPGDRTPRESAKVAQMVEDYRREHGIAARTFTDEEIVDRLVYALVNEGAKVLADGTAARASDIDMVYLNGYGFPLWRGGPMLYADTVGLDKVLARVREFEKAEHGKDWAPAARLVELAEAGGRFNG
ncbi:3-hydroxyacyl-CoA dehydrogenase NAD-binding domain-containing protein [Pandoraea pulmonicola]|uniref:3-hydroxyacyl-CoA dehydrogenase n=1 Tax=Pandoraea pulmonicola TaxID=93221 RepID=A0AAJ4ZH59_PANPU|nr:3-hydroxyacyl-CoA dehydrogenase NAD-binding domain-containing protein [Pandoraea pulmonicola]AJC22520.1 3-hydroxyacyl-CoA dehydrogenase [Pandoraea pulmonicola]SUA93312.1 Fatty acid oxidation complex subunit alpha [Pandoraea pulmonicola]